MTSISGDGNRRLANLRQVESPNFDDRPADADIDLIVVHAISLPPGQFGTGFVEDLFTNRLEPRRHPYFEQIHTLRVSAHFFIDRCGCVTQFVAADKRAWHAGESSWAGRQACNDFSLGIELEGCDELEFTAHQYLALNDLINDLTHDCPSLASADLVGHSDIAPKRKTDPGPYFDWSRVRRDR